MSKLIICHWKIYVKSFIAPKAGSKHNYHQQDMFKENWNGELVSTKIYFCFRSFNVRMIQL